MAFGNITEKEASPPLARTQHVLPFYETSPRGGAVQCRSKSPLSVHVQWMFYSIYVRWYLPLFMCFSANLVPYVLQVYFANISSQVDSFLLTVAIPILTDHAMDWIFTQVTRLPDLALSLILGSHYAGEIQEDEKRALRKSQASGIFAKQVCLKLPSQIASMVSDLACKLVFAQLINTKCSTHLYRWCWACESDGAS